MLVKRSLQFSVGLALAATIAVASPSAAQTIDHTTLPQFDSLTDDEIIRAAALRVSFLDRSVGRNTSIGLDALERTDPRFTRAGIVFAGWPKVMPPPNPECIAGTGGWNGMWTGYGLCATQHWEAHPEFDVVTWWFDYLAGLTTANPLVNFFGSRTKNQMRAVDWAAWRLAHPEVRTFAWTTSLPYSDAGSPGLLGRLDAFNIQMRASAPMAGEVLLDAADILTHDPAGVNCTDPTSGKPRICRAWAADWAQGGGHLTVAGQARMARAVWLSLVAVNRSPAQ